MLKNTQLVSEEISEDMASAKEELDEAVPIHTLLDVSANRSKAELAHKGLLSQRQRPSTEALRATVLRKSVLSSASDNRFPVRKKLFFSSMGSIISVRSGRPRRSRRSGRSAERVAGRSKRSERFAVKLGLRRNFLAIEKLFTKANLFSIFIK